MKALVHTFCARYVLQGDVDEFELSDEEVEYLTVKDQSEIFIGPQCHTQLDLFEDEGDISYEEKQEFFWLVPYYKIFIINAKPIDISK